MIVIEAVAVAAGQLPEAGTVFVTVYVPGVHKLKSTTPVAALMVNPAVEVNVPNEAPAPNVGDGSTAFWQYGPA